MKLLLLLLLGVFLITSHVVSTCPARAAMSNFNTTRLAELDKQLDCRMFTLNAGSASYISFPGALNKMDAASYEAKFNLVRYEVSCELSVSTKDAMGLLHGGLRYKCGRDVMNMEDTLGFHVVASGCGARHSLAVWLRSGRGSTTLGLVIGCVTWLSSRSKTLNATYKAEADQVLPSGDYLASDQSGCP
ncbi:unnamed protein product [Timema podura]|uniref:Uncharacterized protein n=1 Tax=Timema podura TaxID=61482 RepID=A0ABN7NMN1_TIMPD|nr:unnamed protein product [Timema podura]